MQVNIDYPRIDTTASAEEQIEQLRKAMCNLIDTLNILLSQIGGNS